MRLLLDTAALIFAAESPRRLGRRATAVIGNPANTLEFSTVSVAEIAIKAALGKLHFPAAALQHAIADLDLRILPYTADHAFHLFNVPLYHRDPFDRQIIAQASAEQIPVVTPDEMFQRYKEIRVIW